MTPDQALNAVQVAGRFTWETWFAVCFIIVIVLVVLAFRWVLKKHEELLTIIQRRDDEKAELFRELIKDGKTTNETMIEVVTKNTAALEQIMQKLK